MSELIDEFSKDEVETVRDILACMDKPPTASKFRRMLLLFLRGHYASSENYGEEFDHLACYTWSSTAAESTLVVDFSHLENDRYPDISPAIYVKFGGVQLQQAGVGGNYAGRTEDNSGTHISKVAVLTIKIVHIARDANIAYDMAEMSSRVVSAMATPLALRSGATMFEVDGYAEPKEKNPSPESNYAVEMTLRIGYTHAVTRSLESHRLRQIVQRVDPIT